MGSLTLPTNGLIYVDTQCVIYTVEGFPNYAPLLQTLWQQAHSGLVNIISSELTLMETLVSPYRLPDPKLEADFETL